MTGEMYQSDVTREAYPLHFAVADALGGVVNPFDQYQGPYVCIGPDLCIGQPPYAIAPKGLGIIRLWFQFDSGGVTVYNEANGRTSEPFPWDNASAAVDAARSVLDTE